MIRRYSLPSVYSQDLGPHTIFPATLVPSHLLAVLSRDLSCAIIFEKGQASTISSGEALYLGDCFGSGWPCAVLACGPVGGGAKYPKDKEANTYLERFVGRPRS